jgi:hypothetical protein
MVHSSEKRSRTVKALRVHVQQYTNQTYEATFTVERTSVLGLPRNFFFSVDVGCVMYFHTRSSIGPLCTPLAGCIAGPFIIPASSRIILRPRISFLRALFVMSYIAISASGIIVSFLRFVWAHDLWATTPTQCTRSRSALHFQFLKLFPSLRLSLVVSGSPKNSTESIQKCNSKTVLFQKFPRYFLGGVLTIII